MASLRARLVVGLLALAAVGLLALGGITYAEQRSFLFSRLDQQVRSAPDSVEHVLQAQNVGFGLGGRRGGPGDRGDHGGPPPGGHDDLGPPAGTVGQLRNAAGQVLAKTILPSGQTSTSRPRLPRDLPLNRIFTVPGRPAGSPRYRVIAQAGFDGSAVIVAAVPMREVDQTLHRLLLVEGLVIVGVLLVLGVLAGLLVRLGLLPLERMAHTAGAIAGGDLSHRVETTDPRTEVGRLGLALNRMLDRLEHAFAERQASEDRLRQFIADASHELRTPLASIRGYAELFRMGATRTAGETDKSMRRIEEEAARMGVLVEDLLTLARLDEVQDEPRVPVDVGALARDAADDARATAPDRAISLDAEAGSVVLGHADRLRQVLANLLRNALVHTPAGTPVDLRVARSDGDVELEVRDHGPGLPTDDARLLFERFWRAEGGRERGRAGAGLGLAIVAGIVGAHGGSVDAGNAPDGGARFVVRLPAAHGERALLDGQRALHAGGAVSVD